MKSEEYSEGEFKEKENLSFSLDELDNSGEETMIIIPEEDYFLKPDEKDIEEMALNLDIDLEKNPHLKDLVIKAIKEPLPEN